MNAQIKELTDRHGITYFGAADLSRGQDAILEQGGQILKDYPYSISLGIALMDGIVDQLPKRTGREDIAIHYRHHAYDIINTRLDITASIISSAIQHQGYKALPIPASRKIDLEKLQGHFSHKLGARLAGLGWIGKSCLLITPKHGPRVRWASILTDAPVKTTGSIMEENCGSCSQCVNVCPTGAFTNRPFRENEPRELRYEATKCQAYFNSMEEKGKLPVCGLCLYICPHGRSKSGKAE